MHIQPIRFAIAYIPYMIISFLACMMVNTIAAAIVYVFLLLPFHVLCSIYVVILTFKTRRQRITIQIKYLLISILFQGLMILASPASCYGFKQGASCYSLIQAVYVRFFTDESLQTVDTTVAHWRWVELAFPAMLIMYALTMILFLMVIRVVSLPSGKNHG